MASLSRASLVLLFVLVPLAAQELRMHPAKRNALTLRSQMRVAPSAASATAVVDCTKGKKVQEAIDKSSGPVIIEITGLCIESVFIEKNDITLRGGDPSTDGIRSPSSAPALLAQDARRLVVENLAFSSNPAQAVVFVGTFANVNNCRLDGNGGAGLTASRGSYVIGNGLSFTNGLNRGVVASGGSLLFCTACDFTNNAGFAAVATTGGLLSVLDGTIAGHRALLAAGDGSYADIDCLSESTAHPCSLQVTGRAVLASGGGVVSLYGAGDFTGQVQADDRGAAYFYGARQLANGTPPGPTLNIVDSFGTMWAFADFDTLPVVQSRLFGNTSVANFGRLLISDGTNLDGSVQCQNAGDAFVDAGVVRALGVTVTGCDHAN